MKIAIDISPISKQHMRQHAVRGAGFYIQNLKKALLDMYPNETFIFVEKKEDVPSDVDILHYPFFEPFFLTLPFKNKYKTVVTVHDLTPLVLTQKFPAGMKGAIKWQIQKMNLQKADAIITDSQSSKKDIHEYTYIEQEKIHVVPLAAANDFKQLPNGKWADEIRKKYQLPEKFMLYVGDVTPNKNIPALLMAVRELNNRVDAKIPLVMVGKTLGGSLQEVDAYNAWNKDLIQVMVMVENDPNIVRLGFVPTDDIVKIYNSATCFILPSLYEGFGLPVLEAMQSGCPVITTKAGSLLEVAGDAAEFIDPYDKADIIRGIEKVFNNSTVQNKLTHAGLLQANKFAWEKTAKETMNVYRKVANND